MKIAKWIAAGMLAAGLASSPIAADDHDVTYEDAMKCGALYIVLAASVQGEPEAYELEDIAARWVAVAMVRDGTDDGSKAEGEITAKVESLSGAIEEFGEDEAGAEAFLFEGVDWCDGKREMIAAEFDSFETD